jgi:hypothetical protein
VFNPCGHVASQKTCEYWSKIDIYTVENKLTHICPFCATVLSELCPFSRLILQTENGYVWENETNEIDDPIVKCEQNNNYSVFSAFNSMKFAQQTNDDGGDTQELFKKANAILLEREKQKMVEIVNNDKSGNIAQIEFYFTKLVENENSI